MPVQGTLDLHEPDDCRDEEDAEGNEPQTGPTVHRGRLALLRVHLPDLRGDHEGAYEADHDPDHQTQNPAEAVAGVLLHLLLRLERPVPPIETERDDEQGDAQPNAARLSHRSRVFCSHHASDSNTGLSFGQGATRL